MRVSDLCFKNECPRSEMCVFKNLTQHMVQSNYIVITANEGSRAFRTLLQGFWDYGNDLAGWRTLLPKICYFVGRVERGDTGNLHVQAYVEVTGRPRFSSLSKRGGFLEGAHLEVRRADTGAEAADYVRYEGAWADKSTGLLDRDFLYEGGDLHQVFWQCGELAEPRQGARNDLIAIRDEIDAGVTMSTIAHDHFGQFVRYERGDGATQIVFIPFLY